MKRLLIHVEGQTEETFVNELLAPHLANFGVSAGARLIGNARQREKRGGIRSWASARTDIIRHLASDAACAAALWVDFYGLPATGDGGWPGRSEASSRPFELKASTVQNAVASDIAATMGGGFDQARFLPCIMMHEFEAMLFSDCAQFASSVGKAQLSARLQAIRDQFETPEHINDSPTTAPSKRIKALIPGYEKPLFRTIAASDIGLPKIRAECSNFANWLLKLEALDN